MIDSPSRLKRKSFTDYEGSEFNTRPNSISIAIPSSSLQNACSHIMKTTVASQIARSAAIFCVDEILIYGRDEDAELMKTLLEYAECPQYLRKYLFGLNNHLRHAGVMTPLAIPHHMGRDAEWKYREGVCVSNEPDGSLIDVGLQKPMHLSIQFSLQIVFTLQKPLIFRESTFFQIKVKRKIKKNLRVTVKKSRKPSNGYGGRLVSPNDPGAKRGLYWGYHVRSFDKLDDILTSSVLDRFDFTIGTSQNGAPVTDLVISDVKSRILIVFGGPDGLERLGFDARSFNRYVNVLPNGQGTRTIRTEEAVSIVLASIVPMLFIR
ncbi:hypothetical protein ACOME3_008413 [Neoechinorhynchus agilis]